MAAIAIALDVPHGSAAMELVEELGHGPEGNGPDLYKVGLELFTREGPSVVRELRARGASVFLDLKLHDIPATVAGAVAAAADQEVAYLTVHASGGTSMLRAAVEAAEDRLTLLAVTVLTSLSDDDLGTVWGRGAPSAADEAARLGSLAVAAGVGGLVCSPREAGRLRGAFGSDLTLVTPGIRMAGGDRHDQARVATPAEAVAAGSDILVVGRAVTRAPDPREALRRIREDVAEARAGVGGGVPQEGRAMGGGS